MSFEPGVAKLVEEIMDFYNKEPLYMVDKDFLERELTEMIQLNWDNHQTVFISPDQIHTCVKKANLETIEDGWKRLQEGGYINKDKKNTPKGSEMEKIFSKEPWELTDDELEKVKTFHGVLEVIKEYWQDEGKR